MDLMAILQFGGLGLIIIAIIFIWIASGRINVKGLLKYKLLSIRVRENEEEKIDIKEEINKTVQLFSSLAGIKSPFIFEVAVQNIGEEINFYLALPASSIEFAKRQIEGLFPDAQVADAPDYNIFNLSGVVSAGYFKNKENYAFPIRTYEEANLDTFNSILNGFSKIKEHGEGTAIQVIAMPAPGGAKKHIAQCAIGIRKGESIEKVFGKEGINVKDVVKATGFFESHNEKPEEKHETKPFNEDLARALESKISKPLFTTNIRIISSAERKEEAEMISDSFASTFSQFSSPLRNELVFKKEKNIKRAVFNFAFRRFDQKQSIILNAAELSSIFHLPFTSKGAPKINWMRAKEAPAPVNIPNEGIIIGENVYGGTSKEIKLLDNDRRRHIYMVGQTGTGKTTLLKNMIAQDIKNGKGVCLIDPHGDAVEDILAVIPKERFNDVIVFDPSDMTMPIGLNMLEYDFAHPEQKTLIINELLKIFDSLWDMKLAGGPMFEQYVRNTLLLLMEDMPNEPATLMEIERVFIDVDFRKRKLDRCKNPGVVDFWQKIAAKTTGEQSMENFAPWVTSKFSTFTANDFTKCIIGQAKSAFNFREIMDTNKILLIKLSKAKISEINANLLGMIIVSKLAMAAMSRDDIPQDQRKDFYLYIDEFQNVTTDSVGVILSEARKYALNLTIAHQFMAQLKDDIREAVLGNVGSMVAFRIGSTDTEVLEKQFAPTFSKRDLSSIKNFNAYVRLLMSNELAQPFNLHILPFQKGNPEIAKGLVEFSRFKYGVQRSLVEEQIWQRLRN